MSPEQLEKSIQHYIVDEFLAISVTRGFTVVACIVVLVWSLSDILGSYMLTGFKYSQIIES